MVLTTRYNIMDWVRIVEINTRARVMKIQYEGTGILYQLEYWFCGEIKSVWLYEDELAAIDKRKGR